LVVLIGVIVIKELMFRYVHRAGIETGGLAIRTDAWHHRSDAITSLAAAVGISVSVWGPPSCAKADDIAALVAAAIVAWNGWSALRPALLELMDTTPDPSVLERIQRLAEGVPGVESVDKCQARQMGWQLMVDMNVRVSPEMCIRDAHTIAHAVEDHIRTQIPEISGVLIHLEPGREPILQPKEREQGDRGT
jgi:cation diffusion facilitator family transporter